MTGRPARRGRAAASWTKRPVADTGLPPRFLAALHTAGCETCGQWDGGGEVFAAAGLPEEDVRWAETVGGALKALLAAEAKKVGRPPMCFADWLAAMLPDRWRMAVGLRRALDGEGAAPSLHERPLAQVGAELGVTRERARQILESALRVLAAPLAQRLADGLYESARGILESGGGGLFPSEWVRAAEGNPLWSGVSPTGALLVLHQAAPDRIGLYREMFTVLSAEELDRQDAQLRQALRQAGGLLPLGVLGNGMAGRLARRAPDLLALRDGRAGLVDRDAPRLLHEILLARGPLRLAVLAEAFNAKVHPGSQRGTGRIRMWVLGNPSIRRIAPDVYGLAPGFQPELFAGG
jgi:hypothetical protein